MNLTNATVTTGISATAVATAPAVTWREKIGHGSITRSLPLVETGYECSGVLGGIGDELVLELDVGMGAVSDSSGYALGTLTLSGNAVADETVSVGTRVYTWKATAAAANQVKIGATASDSIDNLIAAINAAAGAGTLYGTGTVAHADVTASAGLGETMDVGADVIGSAGNAIATTETMTEGSWGAATLTGGVNASTLVGADGKDIEGATLPTLALFHVIEVNITAGAAEITIGANFFGAYGVGGGFTLWSPVGNSTWAPADLIIAAAAVDTAFTVAVFGSVA